MASTGQPNNLHIMAGTVSEFSRGNPLIKVRDGLTLGKSCQNEATAVLAKICVGIQA